MSGDDEIALLFGNGDGTFTAGTPLTGFTIVWQLLDFEPDGNLDLLLSIDATTTLARGHGDGTFTYHSLAPRMNPDALMCDLDDDGKLDIAIPQWVSATTIEMHFGRGDRTFEPAVAFRVETTDTFGIGALWCGDFDDDGNTDLVGEDGLTLHVFYGR